MPKFLFIQCMDKQEFGRVKRLEERSRALKNAGYNIGHWLYKGRITKANLSEILPV